MNQKKKTYARSRRISSLLLCICMAALCTGCGADRQDGAADGGNQSEVTYRDDVAALDLRNAVAEELGEDYWPQSVLEETAITDVVGLKADTYEEALVEMPMISTNVDTLLIVRAKQGQLEAVQEAVNAYRDRLVNDTMQYPMNLGKIQASAVKTFGSYACFVQLGADTTEALDKSQEAAIQQCQEMNERALGVIEDALTQS